MSDFYEEFSNAITLRAHGNAGFQLTAFGEEVADRLEEAEVALDLTVIALQCTGRNRRKLRLLGYAEDAADSSLIVLCSAFYGARGNTLTKTEAEATFASARAFIEQSVDGHLIDALEISSAEAEHARYFRELLSREHRNSLNRVERFKFILATDGVVSERLRSIQSDEVCGRPTSYSIWDLRRFEELAGSESGQDEFEVDLTKWLPDGLPCLVGSESDSRAKSYLAVLPGQLLADVYAEYGSQLLESNVRTFLSARGKVNRGIQGTLSNQPDMFLAYNNGLTTTATGVDLVDGPGGTRIRSLHNWQIVNGGQTTASLAHFMRGAGRKVDDVYVAMKLVTVEPETASEMVASISRFANSQNAVSEADLFSNSPFHIRLEQISRRILAPAQEGQVFQTKWFYERARGQWENQRNAGTPAEVKRFESEFPKKQRLTKTDWAKFAFSWSQRPHEVSKGAQSNFMSYAKVASELWERDPDQVGDAYFRIGVGKAIMYSDVREAVLESDWYETGYLANIVTYAMSRFAFELSIRFPDQKYDFESVWRRQSLSAASREALTEVAHQMQLVLTADDRPQANVTQWAKQSAAWESAKKFRIELPDNVKQDLLGAAEERSRLTDAKRERQIDSGFEALSRVIAVKQATWELVVAEGTRAGVLSPTDAALVQLVMKKAMPTDRQALRLARILDRCSQEGLIPDSAY
ncbi:AIPR family protein [Microbacterium sulfonylureivorans]|uniref:AIPR family protein n=1 Tax=Microbacterium sulfonylureivorans TaxID=2486854 RepID=UPI001F0B9AD5|nr:AIPR family protein [Microbacterium sulfonylureivorans]